MVDGGNVPFWTKIGHVLAGLREKIFFLFTYTHQHQILPPPSGALQKELSTKRLESEGKNGVKLNKNETDSEGERPGAEQLRILSYNINCLFFHHDQEQVDGVVAYFRQLLVSNTATSMVPDVVCLQEAWEERVIRRLIDVAHDAGWYAAHPATKKAYFVGEHTGLLVLSRFPIVGQAVHIYTTTAGEDCMSSKGAQYLTIDLSGSTASNTAVLNTDKRLHLVNTHLNAAGSITGGASSNGNNVARQQLAQLLQHMPTSFGAQQALLVGDMNLIPSEIEAFLIDCQHSHGAAPLTTSGKLEEYISYPEDNWQLDYCLGLSRPCGDGTKSENEKEGDDDRLLESLVKDAAITLADDRAQAQTQAGSWGACRTTLLDDVLVSDHLPISCELQWQWH